MKEEELDVISKEGMDLAHYYNDDPTKGLLVCLNAAQHLCGTSVSVLPYPQDEIFNRHQRVIYDLMVETFALLERKDSP